MQVARLSQEALDLGTFQEPVIPLRIVLRTGQADKHIVQRVGCWLIPHQAAVKSTISLPPPCGETGFALYSSRRDLILPVFGQCYKIRVVTFVKTITPLKNISNITKTFHR